MKLTKEKTDAIIMAAHLKHPTLNNRQLGELIGCTGARVSQHLAGKREGRLYNRKKPIAKPKRKSAETLWKEAGVCYG